MAGYTLKMHREDFDAGKNILASENGLQFVHGGATLDAEAIGAVNLEAGQAIMRDPATDKYVLYDGAAEGDFDSHSILNVNVEVNGEDDVVVGEVIVRGTVYEGKLVGVDAGFKDANPLIRYV